MSISRSRNASRSPEMIACHDRVLGHVRLHEAAPLREGAPGAARHLMQKLERALARARVGALRQPQVAVDDADGRQHAGKWWPLATICVPMMMSISPASISRMISRISVRPGMRSDDSSASARLGKALGHLLGDALHARPAGDERAGLAALRALLRERHREPAVMAIEPPAEAVLDQPRRALRTFDAVPAGAAQRQRRIAAPVEEQQRLLLRASVSVTASTSGGDSHLPFSGGFVRRSIARARRAAPRRRTAPAGSRGDSGRCAR